MSDDYFDSRIGHRPEEEEPLIDDTPEASGTAKDLPPADDGPAETPRTLKAAVQELLRVGLVEQAAKPNLYPRLLRDREAATAILEPLDFQLRLDEIRGLAFLEPTPSGNDSDDDAAGAWNHPLVRRQRLTTEQSLLLAILRQVHMAYEQDCGIGAGETSVDVDELRAQFDLYLGATGSDQRDHSRVLKVLEQLYRHGAVSQPDKENRVRIRPIVVHLAEPNQLALLLDHFKRLAEKYPADPAGSATEQSERPENDA